MSKREIFDKYEETVRKISGTDEYPKIRPRSVVDEFSASLSHMIQAFDVVCDRFGFLNHLEDLSISELHKAADNLVKLYNGDLEISLGNELVQFVAIIDASKKDYNVDSKPKKMFFYRILMDNNLGTAFSNIEIILRLYLVLMVAAENIHFPK